MKLSVFERAKRLERPFLFPRVFLANNFPLMIVLKYKEDDATYDVSAYSPFYEEFIGNTRSNVIADGERMAKEWFAANHTSFIISIDSINERIEGK